MKKISLLFLLSFINFNIYGQFINIVASQATPVAGGVNVNLNTFCTSLIYNINQNYIISGSQITLSTCYYITPLAMNTNLNENFFIPTPDSSNYVVNLTVYSSQSNTVCDYSTVQASRNLTLSNNDFNIVDNSIKLSPNPTDGSFEIEAGNQTINSIKFYNSLGILIKVSNDLKNTISNMQNGIYYLVLDTEKGTITKKIVLQK